MQNFSKCAVFSLEFMTKKSWGYQKSNQNRRRTDNTKDNRKRTKGHTTIYKTL